MVAKSGIAGPATDRTEVRRRGSTVVVAVDGHHTADAAEQAARYVATLIADIGSPFELVVDLHQATGFTPQAWKHWQTLNPSRNRVARITLVQGSWPARIAASAIGIYIGVRVRFVDTLEQALTAVGVGTESVACDEPRVAEPLASEPGAAELIHPGRC